MKMLILLMLLWLLVHVSSCDYLHVIRVDWSTGRDTESCIGNNNTESCKTIHYAFKGIMNGSHVILGSGEQHMMENTIYSGPTNITVLGMKDLYVHGSNDSVIDCFNEQNTFFIMGGSNITFENIAFNNCGMMELGDGLRNVTLSNLLFNNTKNYYAVVIKNVVGSVLISNCTFKGGEFGGLYFNITEMWPSVYRIEGCKFESNGNYSSFGGGLFVRFSNETSLNVFLIKRCNFSDNMGLGGGALFLKFNMGAQNNTIQFQDVKLIENKAKQNGGGVLMYFSTANSNGNSVEFNKVFFIGNSAELGGGGVIKTHKAFNEPNSIIFSNCEWTNNSATHIGGALAFYNSYSMEEDYSTGMQINLLLNNASFTENRIGSSTISEDAIELGIGIIYSDSVSMNFSGVVYFDNNLESPIYVTSANIQFLKGSHVTFTNNTAVKGAGLALISGSFISIYEGVTLEFYNNHALEAGGAIYATGNFIDSYLLIDHCFMKYRGSNMLISQKNWKNVLIKFSNNSGDAYGSILYSSSFKPCCNVFNITDECNLQTISQQFQFDGDLKVNDVSTDPSSMTFNSTTNYWNVYPGLTTTLPIVTTDELNQTISASPVLLVTCGEKTGLCPVRNLTQYITKYIITLSVKPNVFGSVKNKSFPVVLSTSGANSLKVISITINIRFQDCPIGYTLNDTGSCECARSYSTIPGFVSCNESIQKSVMQVGFWIGCSDNSTSNIVSSYCPPGFCNYNDKSSGLVPIEQSCSDQNTSSCSENRIGRLCGECIEGHSVFFHSSRYRCYKCDHLEYGIIFFVLSELLPLTILFLVVIIFDISLTSGPFSSFVFFAQVLDIFEVTAYESFKALNLFEIISHVYRFIFGFFNLNFFRIDQLSFCIFKNAASLDVLALKYVTTLYAFFLFLILLLVMRFQKCQNIISKIRKTSDSRYTVMNGLVAFVVLTYSQSAKVSFEIIGITKLYSVNNSNNINVVQLAGGVEFLSLEHLKYAIPAFVMIIYLVAVPTALIAHPLYLACKKRVPKNCGMTCSVINIFLMPIMDAFQSAYKEDGRVFAGMLFLYRLLVCVSFSFPTNSVSAYSCLEMVLILMLSLRTIFHPFRSRVDNIVESLIFADLVIINGITLYNIVSQTDFLIENKELTTLTAVQFLLIFIPIAIATVGTIRKFFEVFQKLQKKEWLFKC